MAVGVFDLRHFDGEQPLEEGVHRGQQAGMRAEVVRQEHAAGGFFEVEEELGLGEAEGVDRLLHVADDEEVAAGCRIAWAPDRVEERRLKRVDVLELIDEHVAVAFAQFGGGEAPGGGEQVQREAFEVGEIEAVGGAFGGGEGSAEIAGQGQEGVERPCKGGKVGTELGGIGGEIVLAKRIEIRSLSFWYVRFLMTSKPETLLPVRRHGPEVFGKGRSHRGKVLLSRLIESLIRGVRRHIVGRRASGRGRCAARHRRRRVAWRGRPGGVARPPLRAEVLDRFVAAGLPVNGAGGGDVGGGIGGAGQHAVHGEDHVAAGGFASLRVGFEEVGEVLSSDAES